MNCLAFATCPVEAEDTKPPRDTDSEMSPAGHVSSLVPPRPPAVRRRGVVEGDVPAVRLLKRPRVPPRALHNTYAAHSIKKCNRMHWRRPARWTKRGAYVVDGVPEQPDLAPRHAPHLHGEESAVGNSDRARVCCMDDDDDVDSTTFITWWATTQATPSVHGGVVKDPVYL